MSRAHSQRNAPHNPTKRRRETATHLLKLTGCPPGPVRTVIPEVPVEPAALGAGLGWLAAWGSILDSVVVLMAAQSPCVALKVGEEGYSRSQAIRLRCARRCARDDVRWTVCYSRGKGEGCRNATRSRGEEKVPEQEGGENIEGLYGVEMEIWGRCEGPLMGMWQ